MQKLRELFTDTLVYGISSVLARFINYLLVPFHTDVFKPAQYGVVGLVYAGITFLNVLFTFGMESAYLRYAKDRDMAKNVFKTLQISLLGVATLLGLLLWMLSPMLMPLMSIGSESEQLYYLMIAILWFDTLSIVPFAELRLIRRSYLFAFLKTINVLINLGLNFYLILGLGWGIEAVFAANLTASAITTIVLWIITAHLLGGRYTNTILQKAFSFGWPFVPAGLGFAINETLDRFFLGNYLSEDSILMIYGSGYSPEAIVGIYNACYKLAVFMLLFIQMFRMAWQPFFLRHSDDPNAKLLFRNVFRYYNVAAGIIFLAVALYIEHIVQIRIPILDATLIEEEYWAGLQIVPVLLGAYWFHGWYMNFSAGVFIKERTEMLPQITLIGAGITIVCNLILIPTYGMMGSAWATLLSYGSMALILYIKVIKIYPVAYEMGKTVSMLVMAGLIVFIQPYVINWTESEWIIDFLLFIGGSMGIAVIGIPFRKLFDQADGS